MIANGSHARYGLLLAHGFRPFFLLTAIAGSISLGHWLAILSGVAGSSGAFVPSLYHGHEMVFGFAGGALGGFLLTAVPNWTGTAPVHGRWLLVLVVAFVAGRIAVAWPGVSPPGLVAALDLAYLPLLGLAVGRPIVRATKRRNDAFLLALFALWVGNALMHAAPLLDEAWARRGLLLGVHAVLVIVAIVSGRIVPNFTQNALRQRGIAAIVLPRTGLGRVAVAAMAITGLFHVGLGPHPLTAASSLVAATLLLLRAAGWQTRHTLADPILWILHIGHAWLPIGFALLAMGCLATIVPTFTAVGLAPSHALHGLTAGAIGTLVVAVMSRAALGHTGRPLRVGKAMVAGYLAITLGAVLRVFGPWLLPASYRELMIIAGLSWICGLLVFATVYAPILTRPRVDGKPG